MPSVSPLRQIKPGGLPGGLPEYKTPLEANPFRDKDPYRREYAGARACLSLLCLMLLIFALGGAMLIADQVNGREHDGACDAVCQTSQCDDGALCHRCTGRGCCEERVVGPHVYKADCTEKPNTLFVVGIVATPCAGILSAILLCYMCARGDLRPSEGFRRRTRRYFFPARGDPMHRHGAAHAPTVRSGMSFSPAGSPKRPGGPLPDNTPQRVVGPSTGAAHALSPASGMQFSPAAVPPPLPPPPAEAAPATHLVSRSRSYSNAAWTPLPAPRATTTPAYVDDAPAAAADADADAATTAEQVVRSAAQRGVSRDTLAEYLSQNTRGDSEPPFAATTTPRQGSFRPTRTPGSAAADDDGGPLRRRHRAGLSPRTPGAETRSPDFSSVPRDRWSGSGAGGGGSLSMSSAGGGGGRSASPVVLGAPIMLVPVG